MLHTHLRVHTCLDSVITPVASGVLVGSYFVGVHVLAGAHVSTGSGWQVCATCSNYTVSKLCREQSMTFSGK